MHVGQRVAADGGIAADVFKGIEVPIVQPDGDEARDPRALRHMVERGEELLGLARIAPPVLAGHAKPGDAGTDWALLASTAAQAKLTLVIYMGVTGSQQIQNELLKGLAASTPVAIIQNASLPTQRHVVATLGSLRATIEREHLASPSVIVVGDVLQGLAAVTSGAARAQKQA